MSMMPLLRIGKCKLEILKFKSNMSMGAGLMAGESREYGAGAPAWV
jgi:hypothetical protein